MAKFLFSLLVSVLLGYVVTSLMCPRVLCGRATVALRSCLAFALGSGISSCWFLCWLCFSGTHNSYLYTFSLPELAVAATVSLGYFLFCRRRHPPEVQRPTQRTERQNLVEKFVSAILLLAVLSAFASFILISLNTPHGDFDAVSTWNLRARFLARGSSHWRDGFVDSPSLPHPDYPLLLPATIARCWKYVGSEAVLVPIVVAFLFTFSSVGLLCTSLAILRNRQIGYSAGIVLLGVYSFVAVGASQYADVVVGFFVLATIVLLALCDTANVRNNAGFLMLAGIVAGLCAWTKNEGLLFLSLLVVIRFVLSVSQEGWKLASREVVYIAIGALPVLAIVAYFKFGVAPANYYLTVGHYSDVGPMKYFLEPGTVTQKLMDVSRYKLIAKTMASEVVHLGGRTIGIAPFLLLYLWSAKFRRKSIASVQTGIALLAMMMVGYFFVYLTTPLNPAFHLRTSLLRLLMQLWPASVFVLFMAASSVTTFEPDPLTESRP
jgi:hypothetical protein